MEVRSVRKDGDRLSGRVGDFDLWFRIGAGTEPLDSADPFVAAALLPSMIDGSDIVVDRPVSEALVENLDELQEVYRCWCPGLRKVAIKCRSTGSPTPVPRIGCFYSGGVDSNHSFLRHEREITDLIVISGFDFDMPPETFSAVIARLAPIAESFGKTLMPIETNFFQFERACPMHRSMSHGSCLASTGLALGFRKIYIPSSHPYSDLEFWGTHPLTDRMWGNGCTEFVHDGAGSRRNEKLREIAREQRILDSLVVCWNKANENCGVCGKCLRTRTAFRLLGIKSPLMPPLTAPDVLRDVWPEQGPDVEFLAENLQLARENNDQPVVEALTAAIRRYEFRRGLKIADATLLRGLLLKLYRTVRPAYNPTGRFHRFSGPRSPI